ARVFEVCRSKLGLNTEMLPDNSNGGASEDYSFMSDRVISLGGQSCYFMNMSRNPEVIHNELFDFAEESLINGVKAFAGAAADVMIED
ncbi:MAG: amidohydrolase, partial [Oscillospiraceae bacterium]|nr:amidohydrolase [Oscillospiraceae bacterium]